MDFKVTRHHMSKPAIMYNSGLYPGMIFPDATVGNLFVEVVKTGDPESPSPAQFLAITYDEAKNVWNVSTEGNLTIRRNS